MSVASGGPVKVLVALIAIATPLLGARQVLEVPPDAQIHGIVMSDSFSGLVDQQLLAAIKSLPSDGGSIFVCGKDKGQTISIDPFKSSTKPVTLNFCPGVFDVSTDVLFPSTSNIV